MFKNGNRLFPDLRFFLRAGIVWVFGACVFLTVAAVAANSFMLGEQGLAYLSSAISFFSAAAAGFFCSSKKQPTGLSAALIAASLLIIILLTVGFLINGHKMNPSAVLSIVSFTYAGFLSGSFIHPIMSKNGKKSHSRKLT